MHDSREDEENDEDDFYCYYVGSRKNTDNEASWQKFYGTDSGLSSPESGNSAILDSLIVDIYRNNEYRKLADRDDASEGRNGVQRFYPVSEERRNEREHD